MLAGPAGCLRSRWRSSPRKWRNDAAPRGRGKKVPRTRRCIKTLLSPNLGELGANVRKYLAPEGALRLTDRRLQRSHALHVRKYLAPEGALRHSFKHQRSVLYLCQKVPSTRKCIKTILGHRQWRLASPVRKHLAPEGALRPLWACFFVIRKHCQKSPSTRRCIKTAG